MTKKTLYDVDTCRQCYETFLRPFYTNFRNKLECLSPSSLSSLVQCLRVRPEPTLERFTWLDIRLGWKGLPRTNSSLLHKFVNYSRKKFSMLTPDCLLVEADPGGGVGLDTQRRHRRRRLEFRSGRLLVADHPWAALHAVVRR